MITVEEIERAIEQLPSGELSRLAGLILDRDNKQWGHQLAEDNASGKLDFLFEEADVERKEGVLRGWPPAEK